ncbi:MAG TPA: hypothetical protein DEP27_00265 [Ruminococcaceae bacterium]|nr:hypothetical protein [Oscillospiraceae bacterium]
MYTKKQRTIALVTCLAVLFVTFFSVLFICEEAEHACTGEGCHICAGIHHAEQSLKQLGNGLTETFIIVSLFLPAVLCCFAALSVIPCITPISQKVRMNN